MSTCTRPLAHELLVNKVKFIGHLDKNKVSNPFMYLSPSGGINFICGINPPRLELRKGEIKLTSY